MTLIVNVTTPEGIIIASDSRQTYKNAKQASRIARDSAHKLFALNNRVMVGIAGIAIFPDETQILKGIPQYIDELKNMIDMSKMSVQQIAQETYQFFNNKYQPEKRLQDLEENITKDFQNKQCKILQLERQADCYHFKIQHPNGQIEEGQVNIDPIEITIAGYNEDKTHDVYEIHLPGTLEQKRPPQSYGSGWIGQGDVVARIILGFDGRISNIPFVNQNIINNGIEETFSELRGLEYNIQWETMTLQDAIDFSTLMIKTTTAIQRFSDGINLNPGDLPGVGGPIDIAVITPEKGVQWLNRKVLEYNGKTLDLLTKPDIN
ncbi:MAG: hypothetical protein Q4Q23_03600 [Methanobacteriaceae archaeon]|nr:hypothetical protein [Methanobacteriaceae archaeon]